jgi:hypothetical protein
VSGCSTPQPAERPAAPGSGQHASDFVNRVWQVAESSGSASGQLYVFLSEGTLVIASTTGTPALGRWQREGDSLTLVEEGIAYPTGIIHLSDEEFRLRSHNPGGQLDLRLVPAAPR